MLKKLEKISGHTEFTNPYWDYNIDRYTMPGGQPGTYHYVHSRGSTMIIPRLGPEKFIMTNQYRYLNSRESIEFPGGGIKPGTEAIVNAAEELREETGYSARELHYLGSGNPFNGVTDEICHIYLATGLEQVGASPDPSEEFEISEIDTETIINKIKKGEIWDGMTIMAWALYYFSAHSEN